MRGKSGKVKNFSKPKFAAAKSGGAAQSLAHKKSNNFKLKTRPIQNEGGLRKNLNPPHYLLTCLLLTTYLLLLVHSNRRSSESAENETHPSIVNQPIILLLLFKLKIFHLKKFQNLLGENAYFKALINYTVKLNNSQKFPRIKKCHRARSLASAKTQSPTQKNARILGCRDSRRAANF